MNPGAAGPRYRNYLLLVLTALLVSNYVDRLALGVVMQDIKEEMSLSDTQLGFLSGIAFAVFYSVMGVPIARWADRGNRIAIISLTAVLWSIGVALCAIATSFEQLLLFRVGVAVGEAGCIPPAFALIAHYFTRAERPRAAAIYGLGGPLAFLVGFAFTGWANAEFGWRITFVILGAPGLLLALVAWTTLEEPRKRVAAGEPGSAVPTLREVTRRLAGSRTFRRLVMCLSVLAFFNNGLLQWQPSFFVRSYGMSTAEFGILLALAYGIGGLLGTCLGGTLASRYAPDNETLQLTAMAFAIAACGVLSTLVYLVGDKYLAIALMALVATALTAVNGPLFATIQSLVPDRMRAVAFAIVYLVSNLIGLGLGPLATGMLSDTFNAQWGQESLRYALLCLSPGYLGAAWFSFRASRSVGGDLQRAAH